MASKLNLNKDPLVAKAVTSLVNHCENDPKLKNDKNIHITITMSKKPAVSKDHTPRIIPLSCCKLNKPKELRILLITKDPSTFYKDILTKDEATSELFKEIIGLKNLKRRFRGSKLNQLYKEFDLIVADYRVHHLLPTVLGSRFYNGNKKLPFVIKMSRKELVRHQKTEEECDPIYVRAQIRSICKNTSYVLSGDDTIAVKIGVLHKHSISEMVENIQDIVDFLSDKTKKPQGGIIKGGIKKIWVKTPNSDSLAIYDSTN
ncbi:hypothetical protein Kpol_1060p57 [Vanderwaltozyma polyspora DSM 70294]|uniref:Ribosome biogenesis protein UTP30 n=1 Tax=Vanderwaltozyma polyspora (strain ATCC 22028 / DSM 70294 / BCRC 21397 / CBS 2163 / NBRC 10782 / NRRL Y-8283 / UCD 57-17) TaxID=436907 RepID=A7TK54_VANPO|nr:uncharacterized protein Kpol_1060p57 [Vanderwaltozyma polyspora DSM 70294]EDO17400.1 hypothetical protein Kpol_1060p57 [Vanderwaltozyma polyspora DSM 70294]